jgi:hypothetical protein
VKDVAVEQPCLFRLRGALRMCCAEAIVFVSYCSYDAEEWFGCGVVGGLRYGPR